MKKKKEKKRESENEISNVESGSPLTDDLPNLIDNRDTPSLNHFV